MIEVYLTRQGEYSIKAYKRSVYQAFGLRIASDIPLPELTLAEEQAETADVEIETADLTLFWQERVAASENFVVKDGGFLFQIPGTAIYRLQEGSRIAVSPLPGSDPEKVRVYLLGTCIGALLMQRRILPLHGSAVVVDGKAYAFVGESGAGKSTLAAAFLSRGCLLLSDDVIAVSLAADSGMPIVQPAYPQQKLWQESMDRLGFAANQYRPVYQEVNKYAVPVHSGYHRDPAPLAGVFELVPTDGREIEIRPFRKLEKLHKLVQHTYRKALIRRMNAEQWHFAVSAQVSGRTEMYRLHRPLAGFSAHELTEQILHTIGKGVYLTR